MIRHGQSEDNLRKVYSSQSTPLTKEGIAQILKTKTLLKGYTYEEVYYSPYKRTVESLHYLDLKGKEETRLREIDFGIFTGKSYEEILKIYPQETNLWINDSYNYRIPKGESLSEVYKRVTGFLEEVSQSNKNTLLITHDTVIRLSLCWVFDNPLFFYKFKIDEGSITTIRISEDYKYIYRVNQT
jgi:broad specificity phosphatase PhoE